MEKLEIILSKGEKRIVVFRTEFDLEKPMEELYEPDIGIFLKRLKQYLPQLNKKYV